MPKLKVYGGLIMQPGGKQVRAIVATTSQRKAAELAGVNFSYIRDFWSVTGNDGEIEAAMAEPGVLLLSFRDGFKAGLKP